MGRRSLVLLLTMSIVAVFATPPDCAELLGQARQERSYEKALEAIECDEALSEAYYLLVDRPLPSQSAEEVVRAAMDAKISPQTHRWLDEQTHHWLDEPHLATRAEGDSVFVLAWLAWYGGAPYKAVALMQSRLTMTLPGTQAAADAETLTSLAEFFSGDAAETADVERAQLFTDVALRMMSPESPFLTRARARQVLLWVRRGRRDRVAAALPGLLPMSASSYEEISQLVAAAMHEKEGDFVTTVLQTYAPIAPFLGDDHMARAVLLVEELLKHGDCNSIKGDEDLACILAFFRLGDLRDALGDHSRAFELYRRANRASARMGTAGSTRRGHDQVRQQHLVVRRAFNRPSSRTTSSQMTRVPIFIVGLPRSGTTLLDSLLGAHPAIVSGGEISSARSILAQMASSADQENGSADLGDALDTLTVETLNSFVASEQNVFEALWNDAQVVYNDASGELVRSNKRSTIGHVTQKMPMDYLFIPLIKKMFPAALIIHCVRDIGDTVVSNYKRSYEFRETIPQWARLFGLDFISGISGWASNITDIILQHKLHEETMCEWAAAAVEQVEYEQLVSDPRAVIEPLLARLGLPFDAHCLGESERTAAATDAAAATAVHRRSVGRMQLHADESELEPLLEYVRSSANRMTCFRNE